MTIIRFRRGVSGGQGSGCGLGSHGRRCLVDSGRFAILGISWGSSLGRIARIQTGTSELHVFDTMGDA